MSAIAKCAVWLAAGLTAVLPALGCQPLEDPPSWAEWIWASSPVFVGTVVEIKPIAQCKTLPQERQGNLCAVLSVDDDIRGGLAAVHEVEQYTVPQTSCDHSVPFVVGERWMLVGDYNGYPSERLTGPADAITARIAEVRAVVEGPKPPHAPPQ